MRENWVKRRFLKKARTRCRCKNVGSVGRLGKQIRLVSYDGAARLKSWSKRPVLIGTCLRQDLYLLAKTENPLISAVLKVRLL